MSPDQFQTSDQAVVGSYSTYEGAQRAVDYLSDNKFAVEHTSIVGSDLRMVEKVLGRLNWGRAITAGAGSGAWVGILIGLLLGLFARSGTAFVAIVFYALLMGALFGAVLGAIGYGMTGGRRDFTSRSRIVAGRYDVMADTAVAEDAKNLLIKLGWRT
jgi:hypothetical protein